MQIRLEGNPALDIARHMRAEIAAAERAVTGAVGRAGAGLQAELRGQVVGSGLGARLAKAWRLETYPEAGYSIDAAALVWSKAPKLIRAFDEGATIRSSSGFWLAIPTENAPRRGIGGKRISPATFPEHRYGPLRLIYRRRGPSLLVVDNVRIGRNGRVGRRVQDPRTRSGRLRKGLTSVVMFTLVRQVRLRKRLDVSAATRRWEARLPGLVVAEWLGLEDVTDG